MKRYFLSVAALLLVSVLITSEYEKSTRNNASPSENSINTTAPPPQPPKSDGHPENSEWYSPSGLLMYSVFGWPNGVGVWALIITLFAIAEQSVATTKQAEIARKAIILQFRPKIRVRTIMLTETNDSLDIHIAIFNKGGTPAHIMDGTVSLDWLWMHSPKSHITKGTFGKQTLTAGAASTLSICLKDERLMHSVSQDEAKRPTQECGCDAKEPSSIPTITVFPAELDSAA